MRRCMALAILVLLGQAPAQASEYTGGSLTDCPGADTVEDKIRICTFHIDRLSSLPKPLRRFALSDAAFAVLYAARGEAWVNKRAWEQARSDLDEALRLDPLPAALVLRAIAWHGAGHPAKAIEDTTRAIELAPAGRTLVDALKIRALSLVATKQPARAIGDLERARGLNASDLGILMLKGGAHEMIGERQAAIGCYEAALRVNPKLSEAHSALARLSLDSLHESIMRSLNGR